MTSSVNSPEKLPNWPNATSNDIRADLEDWRTPLLRYLRDSSAIDKSVQRGAFNMCCIMMSSIREPLKTCCLSAWDQIRQEWLWEKSMKTFVVCINWPQR
jgi:hypothetical protein